MSKKLAVLAFHTAASLPAALFFISRNRFLSGGEKQAALAGVFLFSLFYLILMWRSLYAKAYHTYLHRSRSVIVSNMALLASLMACAIPVVYVTGFLPVPAFPEITGMLLVS